jgi:hypothetical protein
LKVYVFGGQKDACIDLANQLNGSGASALIGKEEEDLKEIAGKMGKNFDCAIMVSDDPIKTVVQANRDSRIRAAACYTQKSLKSAASESINLFILDSDSVDKLDFSALAGGASQAPTQQPLQREQAREPFRITLPAPKPKPVQKEQQVKKEPKRVQPAREEEEDSPTAPRSGISGRIKDIFGIVEE